MMAKILDLSPTASPMISPLTKKTREFNLKDFEVGYELGSGTFGKVYLARLNTKPKYIVALKTLEMEKLVKYNSEHLIKREIEVLTRLRYFFIFLIIIYNHISFYIHKKQMYIYIITII